MKKKVVLLVTVMTVATAMSMTAYAGSWKQDATGWWWQNDDGSYPVSKWEWLDGNNDGVAESYCFDARGYMYADTVTPDNYTVNKDGQWTVDGVVQTKNVGVGAGVGTQVPAEQTQTTATQTTGTVQATARGQELYDRLAYEYRECGWSRGDANTLGKAWGYSQADIDYALSLVTDWNAEAIKVVKGCGTLTRGSYTDPYPTVTRSLRYVMLSEDLFSKDEIEYALAHDPWASDRKYFAADDLLSSTKLSRLTLGRMPITS